jgi:hypothetical protein
VSRSPRCHAMTGKGQQHQFPPPEASARYRSGQETIAGRPGDERDAPIPDTRLSSGERVKPTLCGHSARRLNRDPYNARTAFHAIVAARGAQPFLS